MLTILNNLYMRLIFLLDKKYVFLHAFNTSQQEEPFKGWAKFTLNKWQKYPQESYLLAGFAEWPLLNRNISLRIVANKAEKLLEKWLKVSESKKLIKETEHYLKWLQGEWNKKEERVLRELEGIIKIPLPKTKIFVYLTHPQLKNGLTISPNIIVWGHKEEWQNYSVVYLCHEILHTMFWEKNSDLVHAVIEMATDQELRIRLNKYGKYFEFSTHKNLLELEKKLLPAWKKYLQDPSQNLKQFIKKKAGV